jgi:hypothetical protein
MHPCGQTISFRKAGRHSRIELFALIGYSSPMLTVGMNFYDRGSLARSGTTVHLSPFPKLRSRVIHRAAGFFSNCCGGRPRRLVTPPKQGGVVFGLH